MAKHALDLNTLEVASYDPTPAPVGFEDEVNTTPTVTIPIGAALYALSDAYCPA
jgi:hypothetical protein